MAARARQWDEEPSLPTIKVACPRVPEATGSRTEDITSGGVNTHTGASGGSWGERSLRLIVGLIAVVAPSLLLLVDGSVRSSSGGFQLLVLFAAPFAGSAIFAAATRRRVSWWQGWIFGAMAAVPIALFWGVWDAQAQDRAQLFTYSLTAVIVMFSVLVSAIGGAFAAVVVAIAARLFPALRSGLGLWCLSFGMLTAELAALVTILAS